DGGLGHIGDQHIDRQTDELPSKIRKSIELVAGEPGFNRDVRAIHIPVLAQPFAQAWEHGSGAVRRARTQKADTWARSVRFRVDRAEYNDGEQEYARGDSG